jgi:hypothetical protein
MLSHRQLQGFVMRAADENPSPVASFRECGQFLERFHETIFVEWLLFS